MILILNKKAYELLKPIFQISIFVLIYWMQDDLLMKYFSLEQILMRLLCIGKNCLSMDVNGLNVAFIYASSLNIFLLLQ